MKRHGRFRAFLVTLFCFAAVMVSPAHAAWLWDQNEDKIDDRIAAVEVAGPAAAHVGGVLSGKLRFALMNVSAPFQYGVYVQFDRQPTDQDVSDLAALGVATQVRYGSIPYVRSTITATGAVNRIMWSNREAHCPGFGSSHRGTARRPARWTRGPDEDLAACIAYQV